MHFPTLCCIVTIFCHAVLQRHMHLAMLCCAVTSTLPCCAALTHAFGYAVLHCHKHSAMLCCTVISILPCCALLCCPTKKTGVYLHWYMHLATMCCTSPSRCCPAMAHALCHAVLQWHMHMVMLCCTVTNTLPRSWCTVPYKCMNAVLPWLQHTPQHRPVVIE